MSRSDVFSSRALTPPQLGLVQGGALIAVSWDASPDLDEFLHFISTYAKSRFASNMAERVAVSSNELLDNAVRYGSLAREFSYSLEQDASRIKVTVKNTTVLPRIEMLTAQLKRLETAPEQVYASELERSTLGGGRRSMLGLARIRHEAEMQIALGLEGLDVTMCAHCKR